MDEDKAKDNVIKLFNSHAKQETKPQKTSSSESVSARIHFENVHLKDCHITVINHKTIIKS